MAQLTALQRAYLLGFRKVRAQARVECEEMADLFFGTLDELQARCATFGMKRLHQIDRAIAAQREEWMLLN